MDEDEKVVVEGIAAQRKVLDILENLWDSNNCSDCSDKICRHRQGVVIYQIGMATDLILEKNIESRMQEDFIKPCEGNGSQN